MGLPMCKRLLAAGYPLWTWNRHPEKCAPLVALGARQCENPAEVAAQVDLLMLCLADAAAIRQVALGEQGILQARKPGLRIIDFSSTDPDTTRQVAQTLADKAGMRWLDCPVSGGVAGAESGQLIMMAGGDAADIDFVRPYVATLGTKLTHMGPLGAGQVTKICNQLIVAANALLIAEAVALAESAGVDAGALPTALAGGFADSRPLQILAPRMANRQFEPVHWRVQTLLKDLDNAVQLAAQSGLSVELAQRARMLLRQHAQAGHAGDDLSSIIGLYTC